MEICKPEKDDRLYRIVRLPKNDLHVLLISDPTTEKAAASLDVHIGHFSDPEELPGLAHFLEHMLFLGTKKYPRDTEFNEFLARNGGHNNAFTSMEHTNYHFDVLAPHLEEALDRFGQFFTAPLFNEDAVNREINAVNQENSRNLQLDGNRLYQLQKTTSNPAHPFHKFGTGNTQTLQTIPTQNGINVREQLINFYYENYSASLMKLVVLGRDPLDILEDWVKKNFSDILNTNKSIPSWGDVKPYTEKQLKLRYNIVPVKKTRSLKIHFPLPSLQKLYHKSPSKLLSHLIGHEGKGSILFLLKEKGWADELNAGLTRRATDFDIFKVDITLTEEGINHIDDITEIVFAYIQLVRSSGIKQWIYNEIQAVDNILYRFMNKMKPYDYVSSLASNMQIYKEEHVIQGPYLAEEFDEALICNVLDHVTPDNMFVYVVANEYEGKTDQLEKWYKTAYSEQAIPDDFVQKLKTLPGHPSLQLPMVNEFIPTDFEIKAFTQKHNPDAPELIKSTDLIKLWHKQDTQFLVPKADVMLGFYTPVINESLASWVMSVLFVDLLQDDLNAYSYYAAITGLSFNMNLYEPRIEIQLRGYNEKLSVLAKKVFEAMVQFQVNEDRFKVFKQNLYRRYQNTQLNSPYRVAEYYWNLILKHRKWSVEDRMSALEHVTAAELQTFIKRLIGSVQIEAFVHGNMTRDDSVQLTAQVLSIYSPKTVHEAELPEERVVQLERGSQYVYREQVFNANEENSAIYNFYQIGMENTADDVLLDLFCQINKTTFYDQLRTKEQLGYIVFSDAVSVAGVQGFRVEVQSSGHNPDFLDQRIESCIQACREKLSMSPDEFKKQIDVLIARIQEKDKKLEERTSRLYKEIRTHRYQFDRVQQEVEELRTVTQEKLVQFYDDHIADRFSRAKLSIQLWGNKHPLPSEEQPAIKYIKNIPQFKKSMPLYPVHS